MRDSSSEAGRQFSDAELDLAFYAQNGAADSVNDNREAAIANQRLGAVVFEGSDAHLMPGIYMLALVVLVSAALAFSLGPTNFLQSQLFILVTCVGGFFAIARLCWGEIKRRTVNVWVRGNNVVVSTGVPSLKTTRFDASEVLSVQSVVSSWRSHSQMGLLICLYNGQKLHVAGLKNAPGAEALISLQLASFRARARKAAAFGQTHWLHSSSSSESDMRRAV